MSKNKHTRKVIAGYLRTVVGRQAKIEAEVQKPAPDFGAIRKWEKEIDAARKQMRKLRKRLEKQSWPRSRHQPFPTLTPSGV